MRAFSNFSRTFAQNPSFAKLYQLSVLVVEVGGIEPPSDREYLLLLRVQSVLDSRPHAAHRPGYIGLKLPKNLEST